MAGTLLIDVIVRQTTVLIASLATAAGNRPSLAHVANEVLGSLVAELKAQGVGTKVIADMFGMALRTYHDRVARLSASESESGRSLWDAVLGHLEQHGTVLRAELLRRFSRDNQAMVRGVLRDLVRSGLVFQSGQGDHTSYRAATQEERNLLSRELPGAQANLLLVALHQRGPCTLEEIKQAVPLADDTLAELLAELSADGRVEVAPGPEGALYRSERVLIAYDEPAGWEAAVLDHYQALVLAICAKLRSGRTHAERDEAVGGSTYHFDLWQGHPLEREALGFLANVRRQAVALRSEIEAHNQQNPRPPEAGELRVVSYVGQTVVAEEVDEHE